MLFRQRQVRRSSKFSSRMRSTSRQRREYAASVYSMAIIQTILGVSLVIAGVRSWQAVSSHGSELPMVARMVMPIVFCAAGLMAGRAAWGNIRAARELQSDRADRHDDSRE